MSNQPEDLERFIALALAGAELNKDLNRAAMKAGEGDAFLALVIEAQKKYGKAVAEATR
jgi:hypothetical protein